MRNAIFFIALLLYFSSCELAKEDISLAEIIDEQEMLDLVNELRTSGCDCGGTYMPPVDELIWNDDLERAAKAHSIDMNVQNYFSHTSLDGSSFADRIRGTNYEGSPGGENIASGYSSESAVFQGWRNSPGHCTNMMNANHTDIAVGRSGNYWTMVFGRN